jgi:hypothetical protein
VGVVSNHTRPSSSFGRIAIGNNDVLLGSTQLMIPLTVLPLLVNSHCHIYYPPEELGFFFFFLYWNPGKPRTLLQLKLVGILMINLFLT